MRCQILQFALAAFITNTALKGVIDAVGLHDRISLGSDLWRICVNLHILFGFGVAAIDHFAVYFDHAKPASKRWRTATKVAKRRDVDAICPCDV